MRLGWTLGRDEAITRRVLSAARRGWRLIDGDPVACVAMIAEPDAARASLSALAAPPGTYNITDGLPVAQAELNARMEAAARAGHCTAPMIRTGLKAASCSGPRGGSPTTRSVNSPGGARMKHRAPRVSPVRGGLPARPGFRPVSSRVEAVNSIGTGALVPRLRVTPSAASCLLTSRPHPARRRRNNLATPQQVGAFGGSNQPAPVLVATRTCRRENHAVGAEPSWLPELREIVRSRIDGRPVFEAARLSLVGKVISSFPSQTDDHAVWWSAQAWQAGFAGFPKWQRRLRRLAEKLRPGPKERPGWRLISRADVFNCTGDPTVLGPYVRKIWKSLQMRSRGLRRTRNASAKRECPGTA